MANKIKEGNYINIQSFMVNDLNLKGNELLVYAIIYGFTQNYEDKFTGGLQYLCDWTSSTKQGIIKNLKSLVDKGLIEKSEVFKNGVKFVEYSTIEFTTIKQSLTGNETKFNDDGKQSLTGGIKQSLPKNINSNNLNQNNINNNKESKKDNYNAIVDENFSDDKVKTTLFEFIKMRKLIKKPLTDFALKKICSALKKLSTDPSEQVAILEQSIINNWQGIFPLKTNNNYSIKQPSGNFDDVAKAVEERSKQRVESSSVVDENQFNF